MKYLFLVLVAVLMGVVIFLIYDADQKINFPFGGPYGHTIRDFARTGDQDVLRRDSFYIGYRANNNYRVMLACIGVGISITCAVGWIAIRRGERSTNASETASKSED